MPRDRNLPKLGSARGGLAKIGSMHDLQEALWEIIAKLKGEGKLIDVLPLKAAHTLATLAGVYVRLHEVADLAPRMEALEARLDENKKA